MRPFRVRVPITDFIEFLKVASGTNEIFTLVRTPPSGRQHAGLAVNMQAGGVRERAWPIFDWSWPPIDTGIVIYAQICA